MDVAEALARLKFLVRHDRFQMVRRRQQMATPVSVPLAKEIVRQLSLTDFVKHEPNRTHRSMSGSLRQRMAKSITLNLFSYKAIKK